MKKIERFIHGRDYRDICYFIDHITDLTTRVDVLKKMGYQIGIEVPKFGYGEKHIYIGKKNEIRFQITPKLNGVNLAYSIIITKI